MFSRLHERLGTAGFVVAIVALIAALGGTALAAAGLNGKQKKEVTKIAKKYAGKPGAPGATGPAGPAGPAGAKGDKGDAGTNGTNGTNGTPGTNGKNVILKGNATVVQCPDGGKVYEVEGSGTLSPICNGEEGPQGEPGEPWSVGGVLPPGETMAGVWGTPNVQQKATTYNVSFNIPLAQAPTAVVITPTEMDNDTADAKGCPWEGTGTPTADPGKFCVYEAVTPATANLAALQVSYPAYENFLGEFLGYGEPGASTFGAAIRSFCTGTGEPVCEAFGAWAVTAHVAP